MVRCIVLQAGRIFIYIIFFLYLIDVSKYDIFLILIIISKKKSMCNNRYISNRS